MKLRQFIAQLSDVYAKKKDITLDCLDILVKDTETLLENTWIFENILQDNKQAVLRAKVVSLQEHVGVIAGKQASENDLELLRAKVLALTKELAKTVPPALLDQEMTDEATFKKQVKPVDILVVCVGNVDRSPALEAMLKYIVTEMDLPQITARSNGVFALYGNAPEKRAKPYQFFIDKIKSVFPSGEPRPITEESCAQATIILTAAPYISDMIKRTFPMHRDKVFEMRLFVADQEKIQSLLGKSRSQGKPYFSAIIEDVTFSTLEEKALESFVRKKEKELGRPLTPEEEGQFIGEFISGKKSRAQRTALLSFLRGLEEGKKLESLDSGELRERAIEVYLRSKGVLDDPTGAQHPELVREFEDAYGVRYRDAALAEFPYRKNVRSKVRAESIASRELSRLAFAIIRSCISRRYVVSDPSVQKFLLYKLAHIAVRPTHR